MTASVQVSPIRANPHLRAMLVTGGALAVVGAAFAMIGSSAIARVDLLIEPERWGRAQLDIAMGASIFAFGTLLLLIGWTVAAARHR
jgi:hypothetical protein